MQAKQIKTKIASVKNIQKITKTMEMVSASKMRKARKKGDFTHAYAQSLRVALEKTLLHANEKSELFQDRPTATKRVAVILASEKGLAGPFLVNITREFKKYVRTYGAENIQVIAIGKQAVKIAKREKVEVILTGESLTEKSSINDVEQILQDILDVFVKDESVKAIDMVSAKLEGLMSCYGATTPLVPTQDAQGNEKTAYEPDVYIFEPSRPYMVNVLTKLALKAQVYDTMITSLIAEHAMRMTAMKNATDNAKRLQEELKLTYNRARQAAITQEISEIINASQSVSTE